MYFLNLIWTGELFADDFKYLVDRAERIYKNGAIVLGVLAILQSSQNIMIYSIFSRVFLASAYEETDRRYQF